MRMWQHAAFQVAIDRGWLNWGSGYVLFQTLVSGSRACGRLLFFSFSLQVISKMMRGVWDGLWFNWKVAIVDAPVSPWKLVNNVKEEVNPSIRTVQALWFAMLLSQSLCGRNIGREGRLAAASGLLPPSCFSLASRSARKFAHTFPGLVQLPGWCIHWNKCSFFMQTCVKTLRHVAQWWRRFCEPEFIPLWCHWFVLFSPLLEGVFNIS